MLAWEILPSLTTLNRKIPLIICLRQGKCCYDHNIIIYNIMGMIFVYFSEIYDVWLIGFRVVIEGTGIINRYFQQSSLELVL